MNYIYKFYYVFFLYYSKFRNEVPWFGAICVITICFFMTATAIIGATGLFYPLMDLLKIPGIHYKIPLLLFTTSTLCLIDITFSYLLFKKMKVSRQDGRHPNYEFNPTKKDKWVAYSVAIISFSLPFIVKGILIYFDVE